MPSLRLRPEFEQALTQLPGVRAASVITGPDAHPTEIHVLAASGKAPKQVVRDVQSLAMAQYDLDIDHRIVSVVQIDLDEVTPERFADGAATEAARPIVASVLTKTASGEAEARVAVTLEGTTFEGVASGPGTSAGRPRLVARAALDAVSELLGSPAELEQASLVSVGERVVAVCVIAVMVPRVGEQLLTGSALVRDDEADAVARAVLDALNRRLTG